MLEHGRPASGKSFKKFPRRAGGRAFKSLLSAKTHHLHCFVSNRMRQLRTSFKSILSLSCSLNHYARKELSVKPLIRLRFSSKIRQAAHWPLMLSLQTCLWQLVGSYKIMDWAAGGEQGFLREEAD